MEYLIVNGTLELVGNMQTNKQLTQQNLRELAKLTLLNILSAKGLYYQKYQKLYQQKRQSYPIDYLPNLS